MDSYRRFLHKLDLELQAAVAEAENMEMHHAAEGSGLFQHYLRLCTWCQVVEERIDRYDTAKRPTETAIRKRAEASEPLG